MFNGSKRDRRLVLSPLGVVNTSSRSSRTAPICGTACRDESGLPFRDVVLVRGLEKGEQLPIATLLEVQRRFRTNHDGWRDRFDWIYYTESDQVLRYRADQLGVLLGQVPPGANDAVLVPHRMSTWPTSLEFPGFPGNLSEGTAERLGRLGSNNVTLV